MYIIKILRQIVDPSFFTPNKQIEVSNNLEDWKRDYYTLISDLGDAGFLLKDNKGGRWFWKYVREIEGEK